MFKGELVENRIVIWDIEQSRKLFTSGFFGKPLGIPKPKGDEFTAPLILDLIEGYYLMKERKLKIQSCEDKSDVNLNRIQEICVKEYVDFDHKYTVYQHLRKSGLIVSPGIKFGCDFAVYIKGPGIDHAPYLVQVMKSADKITATGVVLAGRLATTVKKKFIIAVVEKETLKIDFISFDWWRA